MINNNLHNLLMQMGQENKSLWRIKNEYLRDADGDQELKEYWQKKEKDKETHVAELKDLIKKYLD